QMTHEQTQAIVATQASRGQRWQIADAVVCNGDGIDLESLRFQVAAWARPFGLMMAAPRNSAA
ncbi:MAG: dephospho-CoA kinase, partial [Brachymonas sp.]|nr:dephospho-CoA kinase [Brachymonas sp.]